jgi:hypothetical protein
MTERKRQPPKTGLPLRTMPDYSSSMRYAAMATLALIETVGRASFAQPVQPMTGVDLAWNAPDGCPPRDAVLAEVSRVLGGSTSRRSTVRADVARLAPERWAVHLVTDVEGTAGERSFEADSCVALASATALIVAWTVDPLRASAAPAPVESPRPEPAISRPDPPGHALSGLVAMSAQGDLGSLPSVGASGELAAGVTWRWIRVEGLGSLWAVQDANRSASEGAHLQRIEAGLRGCWRGLVGSSLEVDPCLGARLTQVSSQGFGETTRYQRDAWGWSLDGDVLATWTLVGPVALRAMLGVAVPLTRPPVVIVDSQGGTIQLLQSSVVAGRAALGVEVRFP